MPVAVVAGAFRRQRGDNERYIPCESALAFYRLLNKCSAILTRRYVFFVEEFPQRETTIGHRHASGGR